MSDKHLTPTAPEWPAMWEALADVAGDYADCCPETGECWQYMGTYDGAHQFRHRNRPQLRNGRTTPPINGFAGQHWGRVYLDISAETLQVVRLHVQPCLNNETTSYQQRPAPQIQYKQPQRMPRQIEEHEITGVLGCDNCCYSDADPGL